MPPNPFTSILHPSTIFYCLFAYCGAKSILAFLSSATPTKARLADERSEEEKRVEEELIRELNEEVDVLIREVWEKRKEAEEVMG
jgi:hypothetical protein